jgi:undecaprenyl-diphosphatase UppP
MTIGWLQIVVLALVQGVTEFLPISSSAHLILVPRLTHWPDQGLAFDLAVHLGTLIAVVYYFRRELGRMSVDFAASLRERRAVGESRLAFAVLWGTVPVGIAGLLINHTVETELRSPVVIAATTIAFGVLLWIGDVRRGRRTEHEMSWRDVLVIGCAQAIALVPGTSRSGITITAAMLLGLSRGTLLVPARRAGHRLGGRAQSGGARRGSRTGRMGAVRGGRRAVGADRAAVHPLLPEGADPPRAAAVRTVSIGARRRAHRAVPVTEGSASSCC